MYERKLRDYLPQVVRNVREFQALAEAEQPEMDLLFAQTQAVQQNQFLDTLQEEGCVRWEKMLKIEPKGTDDLTVRRFRIKSRLNEELPYTFRRLCQVLDALCGAGMYKLTLYHTEYCLHILLELGAKRLFDEVREVIGRMVPANIQLEISLRYNRWQDVRPLTWGQAVVHTWGQIREEEIRNG